MTPKFFPKFLAKIVRKFYSHKKERKKERKTGYYLADISAFLQPGVSFACHVVTWVFVHNPGNKSQTIYGVANRLTGCVTKLHVSLESALYKMEIKICILR